MSPKRVALTAFAATGIVGLLVLVATFLHRATNHDPARLEWNPADSRKRILAFGDSLTAGGGLEAGEVYTSRLQQRIDALGLEYHVINAGVAGDTSLDGLARFSSLPPIPIDILILQLGGNDVMRNLDLGQMQENLQAIINLARQRNPKTKILLIRSKAPPWVQPAEYRAAAMQAFEALSRDNRAVLAWVVPVEVYDWPPERLEPFLQDDKSHLNHKGHELMADTVWQSLEVLIGKSEPAR